MSKQLFKIRNRLYINTICFILAVLSTSSLSALTLKEQLKYAQPGDYIVTAQKKNITVLHISDVSPKEILIEEVTSSANKVSSDINWKRWMRQGAPDHTSWIMYRLDLDQNKVLEAFSFTHNGWMHADDINLFFITLLNLPFEEIETNHRKRQGPPLPPGEIDSRPIWHPPIYVDGKLNKSVTSKAYKALWPKDYSELSGHLIEIFIPEANANSLSYFPYWLQVSNLAAQLKIRVIDSGKNMISIHPNIPKRSPTIEISSFNQKGELSFQLFNPSDFKEFEVYAFPVSTYGSVQLLSSYKQDIADNRTLVTISKKAFDKNLEHGLSYHFVFIPDGNHDLKIQTPNPIKIP